MDIKELLTPDFAITWLPWAVQYFFLIGLAYTAVWIGAIAVLTPGKPEQRLLTLCGSLIISAAIVAPVALLADLHQPLRAWHFYMQIRPHSWMWLGAWLLPLFMGSALLFGYLLLRPSLPSKATGRWSRLGCWLRLGNWSHTPLLKPAALIAALSAASIALYTGMETMAVEARPLWHSYWLPPLFAASALLAGSGMLVWLNFLFKGHKSHTDRYLLLWLRAAFTLFGLLLIGWALMGGKSAAEAQQLLNDSPTWQLAAMWVLATLALLALLLAIKRQPHSLLLLAGFAAMHLAWGFRWLVLIQAQTDPKYGAGTYFYQLPWGPEGLLGILGTFGLWLALITLISELVRQTTVQQEGAA
ncbi:NrfD/PsrC family molybdoenzyme membrane anchor subunit [Shewanella sp. YIC-542]|uniref:NrfD/PsrC family molybdoenzyme membrane anchor subunit n=1 Tax=Shewanella mytili TaxID=3377111 RepID=UPI00398EAC8E